MSKKYKLSKKDAIKIGHGALIAMGGVLLTYLAEVIPNVDFGDWTPVVVALCSVLVNVGRKFLTVTNS